MKSNKTDFDELDLKCLTELPILLDVLSSTGSKIARIFKPLTEECDEIIKSNMPKNWSLDSNQSYNLLFFPFYGFSSQKKITIEALDNAFKIESAFYICKKVDKKHVNFLWVYFGYTFSNMEDDSENHYYFSIAKEPAVDKYEGCINSNEFYKNISLKNKSFEIEIEHPERGGTRESIDVKVKEHNIEKIQASFNFFKTEVLIPTLRNIKQKI